MKTIPFGVSKISYYDPNTLDLILVTNTLTDSALNGTASEVEIRAGIGAGVIGNVYHSSGLTVESTDATFNLDYLALKFGTVPKIGGTEFIVETVVSTANIITVVGTPVEFITGLGLVGWYKLPNELDDEYKKIVFTGKVATVAGLALNTTLCVKFCVMNDTLKEIEIPANMIPQIVYAVMESDLYKCTETGKVDTTSSKVGKLVTEIPQFQFNPNMALANNMTGNSTMAVGGKALINMDNSCNGGNGYYGKIKEIIVGKKWHEDVINLTVSNPSIDLATGGTETIEVYALYKGGTYKKIANSNFTFVSSTPAKATVTNAGLVTFVAIGSSNITVTATDKPSLDSIVQVTCA